jgi:hypothetical protein
MRRKRKTDEDLLAEAEHRSKQADWTWQRTLELYPTDPVRLFEAMDLCDRADWEWIRRRRNLEDQKLGRLFEDNVSN